MRTRPVEHHHLPWLAAELAPGHAHIHATLLTSMATAVFAWNQNRGEIVGGPIHWSKAAWLSLSIVTFIVLPGIWWRSSTAGSTVRSALGTLSLSFVVRGALELPLIYQDPPKWKCGYGITHDFFAFIVLGAQLLQGRGDLRAERDGRALAFCAYAMVLLLAEANFARLFRAAQDPATGIYFADDSPHFRTAIRVTKVVIAIGYPVLVLLLWTSRRDFPRRRRA